ncbi:uncharacterized protein [Littorina saxatilis]|uniref:uncharacterized protein n=1 Tax=Littorina saxatilis TaxID=31220 RepID=UPI0038B477D2
MVRLRSKEFRDLSRLFPKGGQKTSLSRRRYCLAKLTIRVSKFLGRQVPMDRFKFCEVRSNGGLSLHGQEFHVGGEVNVTHARNELHQHAHVTCKTYARKLVEKHVTFNNTDNAAGYEQIKDQSRNEITLDEQLFVQTSSFNTAMDHLQQKGLLLIQGPPGSGKSALGHALLRHYEGQEYTPLVLHRCEEWRAHVGGDRKQVVLLDGVLGEVCLDQASFTEWSKVFACLFRYAKAMKCLVVFVMYKHVFKELEARGEVGSFFQHVPVLDLQRGTTFTDTEKKEMIRKHMEGINMPPSVEEEILLADQSGSLFPGCVKRFKQAAAYQDIEDATFVFSSPSEPLASFLCRSLSDRDHGTCVAAMLLLTLMKQGDCFAAVEKVEAQLKFLGFDKSIARKVQSLAKSYRGTYIAWNKSAFCSRPVHGAACRALARTEYLSIMIKVCDLEFLLTHVSAFDDGAVSKVDVSGDTPAMRQLHQRILQELVGGNVPEICQHPCLQKGDFLAGFKRFCVLENCLDKVLAATDPKYNDSLLYWASVCGSHALTEWCATLMLEKNTDPKGLVVTCQRILFLYALMDERRSSQCVKTMTFAMEKCGVRPELMSSVTLPLPDLSKRYTRDMKGRCDALIKKTLSNVVCYLGDASLAFPNSVISLQKMQYRPVILVKFPGKHWYTALRILSDRNIDEQDEDGNTFLHLAADRGDAIDVEISVRSGASLGIVNNKDQTPPQVAKMRRTQSSSSRVAGVMTSDKMRFESNHFKNVKKACQEGDLERLKVLLCYSLGVDDTDSHRNTPLMICCQFGQIEACRLLVHNEANINAENIQMSFPLLVASDKGFQDIVDLLIEHGAQVNKVGHEKTTPLPKPSKKTFTSFWSMLLHNAFYTGEAEAEPKKITSLCVASKNGHTAVAQILLEHGAQANKDEQERTALHVACENNRVEVVRLLLEYGVNPEGSEAQKESPLHLAYQSRNEITLDEQLFVQRSSFKTAMDHLQQDGLLLIQGPPGSGKSALGHALLRHYEGQEYTPLVLHRCEEWRTHVGGDRKQVVLLDGVLGEVCLDQASFTEWSKVFACMLRYAKAMKCLVVFVMYKHVFKELEARGEVGSFFQHVPVLDLQRGTTFTDTEKKEMIRKHMEGINMPPSVEEEILLADQSGSLFPGCVKRFKQAAADQTIEDGTSIFSSPSEPLASFLCKALADRDHGTCVAAMLLLTLMKQGDCLAAVEKMKAQLQFLGFDKKIARKVQSLAKCYKGTYIALSKSAFCSRPVHEAACMALASTEYLSVMIKVCDLRFLLTHVGAFDDGAVSKVDVSGDTPAVRQLHQRLLQELVDGNVPEICQHPNLQKGDFLAGFKRFCILENCLNKVLAAKDPKHNDSLLYWSAVCGSHTLTDWCATLMLEKCTDPKGLVVTCQRILFLYALTDERRSSQCVKNMTFAMEKCGMRPELMSSVNLPLPDLSKRYTRDMKGRCDALITKTLSNVVCYLGDASLVFPTSVISLQKMQHRPGILVKFPGKHWSMALRILSDRNIDEQDEDGNTFLHLAADRGDVLDVEIAVRSGASLGIVNNKNQTPPQVAKMRRTQSSSSRVAGVMASDKKRFESNHFKNVKKACQEGDLERLKVLLCYSHGVNDADNHGNTPLMICCQYDQIEACRLLVHNEANINAENIQMSFPLLVASDKGFQDIVDLLIEHGAQVNKVGHEKTTPLPKPSKKTFPSFWSMIDFILHNQNLIDTGVPEPTYITSLCVASKNGHTAVAQLLLEHGAQANKDEQERTALHFACENNRVEVVRLLLEHGANPDGSEAQKESPLHLACKHSNSVIVGLLIAKGANVNTANASEQSPLHFACSNANAEVVDTLITRGADINVTDIFKLTPLHFACNFGLTHIAALLIKHGVKLDCEDHWKRTPLYMACDNGHESVATLLIFHRAPVSSVTEKKRTLLHPASRAGVASMVQLLIRQGVDVLATDTDNKNGLHVASANGHLDIVEQLLEVGLDVSLKDNRRKTSLHYASAAGHTQIADLLILRGAEVNCRDDCLQTPLFYAAKNGHADTAMLLLSKGAEISASDWKHDLSFQAHKTFAKKYYDYFRLGEIEFSKTPLHAAIENGHLKIAEQLVRHEADVNAVDKNKHTPLHYAYRNAHTSLVDFLLQHGADANSKDIQNRVPADLSPDKPLKPTCQQKTVKVFTAIAVFLVLILLAFSIMK